MKTIEDKYEELLQVAKYALADLEGSLQAYERGSPYDHDWKAHMLTINELTAAITQGEEA
jgi:hypothetical protein